MIESYVLYDPETKELIGGYVQIPPPEHVYRVPVSDEVRMNWPLYRLTEDMLSVELIPWWEDVPDPQDPPVDPDPEPPVQSGN